MDKIPKEMAQEWGQFIETVTPTEYKAAVYDSQVDEVAALRREVAQLKSKIEKLEKT